MAKTAEIQNMKGIIIITIIIIIIIAFQFALSGVIHVFSTFSIML